MKKLILLAGILLTTINVAYANLLSGNLNLDDGKNIFRIDIGDRNGRSTKNLSKRVFRLERAVRELQNLIYDLEDRAPARNEMNKYTCVFTSCRESSSNHVATKSNCDFFNMWQRDSVKVWAYNGYAAEKEAIKKINDNDGDIKHYMKSTINCN